MIQYNTTRNLLTSKLTPFYLNLSRDRVTEEDSTVKILNPLHRALNFPHKITSKILKIGFKKEDYTFQTNGIKLYPNVIHER